MRPPRTRRLDLTGLHLTSLARHVVHTRAYGFPARFAANRVLKRVADPGAIALDDLVVMLSAVFDRRDNGHAIAAWPLYFAEQLQTFIVCAIFTPQKETTP